MTPAQEPLETMVRWCCKA